MMRRLKRKLICLFVLCAFIQFSQGCQMEGVTNWLLPVSTSILDTFSGNILDRSTSSIEGINSISYGEGLNSGPYVDISYADSQFVMTTNNEYALYEEYETLQSMPITITFRCTGGSTSTLVFLINVVDTNNNAPQFQPPDGFVFTIAPPLPPGFEVTGCFNDISVRDIDLTTQRIEFEINDNPYFEIEYDAASSTSPKEFKATLRTISFIRTLPEPITFTISATDVDLTGDPPLTTRTTVTIIGDTEFEFPEEPVFSEAFYLANYTNNQLVLSQQISLRSGYDELVQFSLEGVYSNNFELVRVENDISIRVEIPLPADALMEKQILLIIRANREYTSGDTATIIVELPEDIPLQFEKTFYEGTIENNELRAPQLVLNQGYSDATITAVVISEYSSFFTANLDGNIVSLIMAPLMVNIIEENSFINIEIVASTERSTATAVVTLEIIKDDTVTPVFNKPIYSGSYNPDTGLTLEEILLVQGYDQTVVISLEGEHEDLFQVQHNGVAITLTTSNIPSELFGEQQIILTIIASKARTVGANAAVIINLPAARELLFEASTYRGILEENALTLGEILLSTGYDEDISFDVTGDYGEFFTVTNVQNQVIISYTTSIPENIITENNVLILTITASGTHAVTAATTLLLEIIKDDTTTPVFSSNVYYGTYTGTSINIENIFLIQGFSNDVSFELDGDQTHLEYFGITGFETNNIQLELRSEIPENLIFEEKFFLLNIKVDKRRTVGASAVILIRFPTEFIEPVILRFAQNTYTGTIENNVLTTESIVLSSGYAEGTGFQHFGDYSSYFELTDINNAVSLSLINTLPIDEIDTPFIVLEIEARRERAVSVWTSLVIDLVRHEIISPVFTEVFYRGVYSAASGLQFNDEISLLTGFDYSVDFDLEGEHAALFTLVQRELNSYIVAETYISQEILDANTQFLLVVVAHKPGTTSARSTISIAIEKEPDVLVLGFAQNSYVGVIDDNQLQLPTITIVGDNAEVASVRIIGEYEAYFTLRRNINEVYIEMTTPLPTNVVNDNAFITFEIEASHANYISGIATIIVRTERSITTSLQFDQVSYIGTLQETLAEIQPITLIEGYTNDVTFELYGDLSEYFSYTPQGAVVNVALQTPIPVDLIPANRIIVLEIRASSPLALSAYATIVFEVIVDEDVSSAVQLVFDAAYYTGSYGATAGLVMDTSMSLSEGYDDSVQFELEGADSQWFSLTRNQNSVTLVVSSGIPGAVLTNNRHLIFAIAANRPGSITARSAIVVAITDEYTDEAANIGFDRVTYVGTIENNIASLQPITLIEGYTIDVAFGLYGDLSEYFSYTPQGAVVNVALQTPIPADLIPANRIIVLEIRASSPLALSAYATIVFEVIVDEDVSSAVQLVFDAAYYTGSYGATAGLVMDTSMSLSEGYDDSVQFELEGADSQWFSLTRNQNSVTLVVSSGIPGAVLTNNRHLIFAIAANRPGSITARSAIVVALTDEYTDEAANIGFDRVTYVGTIENNIASLQPITLIEGYTIDVAFGLYGDLSEYFSYTPQGAVVNVALQTPIPVDLIPANRIIVLEIRASSPLALSAYATIVFEVIVDEDVSSAVQLVFDAAYYTGSYGATAGLVMDTSMSLSEGYDDSVQFELEGADSQWFSLTRNQNSVTLVVSSGIPGAVLTNNRHLIFAIAANRPGSITARSAIVVAITDEYTDEAANIGFDRVTYVGTIENNIASLQPITLIEGYTIDVAFGLYGDLSEYFSYTPQGAVVNVALQTPIPADLIPANRIIVLEIRASSPLALSAYATIVFEVIVDEDVSSAVQLVFDAAYYTGSYGATAGLVMDTSMSLSEGYDDSVQFELEGADSQWFSLTRNQNSVTLVVSSGIPGAVLTNNRHLIFAIAANRPGSITARSAIVVALTDEYTDEAANIGFDRVTYVGTIENNIASLQPITLIEGYTIDVAFGLYGDLSEYFSYTPQGAVVNVALQTPIPVDLIPANRIIVLEIRASSPLALSAYATIVFEVIVDEDVSSAVQLVFDAAYYTGSYGATAGLVMDTSMSLSEGYDDSVQFELEGADSQWFSLTRNQNSVTLVVSSGIPGAVLTNNRHLIFAIAANRPGSTTARSAIVVALTDEYTDEAANIGFDRVTYVGTIENNKASLQPITLIEGYTIDVAFGLYGDLSEYFSYTPQGAVVNVALQTPIPVDLIPANRIIVLEIRASSPLALSAYATIVFEVIVDEDVSSAVQLVFDAAYYTGSYGATAGLVMDTSMSLSEGYEDSVQFELEGADSQWFSLTRIQNSVTLVVSSGIPGAVLTNNRHLIFAIAANRPGSTTARSAIVVALTDEYTDEAANIGFDRVTYVGTIENNIASLQPITLIEGYTIDVAFGLYGDLSEYFSYTPQGAVVNVALQTPIPVDLIPANRIIVLEIRASSPLALSAYATIVFEVIVDEDVSSAVQLVFDAAYYTGSYGATAGLVMDTSMSLSEGYDDSVQFELEGADSQWFSLTRIQNSVTLVVSSGIPGAVLTNNRHLIFAIAANRPGSTSARSAIVVALTDEYTDEAANIGFDRVTYVGTIENNVASLQPITLIEGYTIDVAFELYGDLSEYFSYTPQGAVVNVALQTPIPVDLIPANRIIVLEIRASSPLALSAYATIVFEVIVDEDVSSAVQLVFDAAYYTGSYGATAGLVMDTSMSLSEGYDDSVQFELEGADSQWFSLTRNQNSVTLVVSSGIPGAVLANNRHLIFAIAANRPGSTTARSAIVVALTDEYTDEAANIGFDRVTYVGTIENNIASLQPITLIEGYTIDVAFGLYGDLSEYFSYTPQGAVVNVALQTPIPVDLIPANRIIVLEIRASSPLALSAYATIVFEVIVDEDVSSAVQLVFDAAYYTGSYGATAGLVMDTSMSLSEGYDDSVQFELEGADSQWFSLTRIQNSVTLVVSSGIPGAVLTNNRHLIFAIAANRPGSTSARSAIVVALTDEYTDEAANIGFDRVTYVGTIENNVASLQPITLIEGYTIDVAFELYGDLSEYFSYTPQGAVVNVALQTPIPADLIPANRIIVLEILASSPLALSAYATIVFEVIVDEDVSSAVQLVFDAAFYTGSYGASAGLVMDTSISLSEGYDDNVQFELEGDDSQWFSLTRNQNSVTLVVSSEIPGAVLINVRQLVFAITANRPGSISARSAIVVSLFDDLQAGTDVSFEKVLYDGIIQLDTVIHESIVISGFSGTNVDIFGDYSNYFEAYVLNGIVTVQATGPLALPTGTSIIALELHADIARAVLLLNILQEDVPIIPSVVFGSQSYRVNVDVVQTGLIGRVQATADNGEAISYSLAIANAHLQTRLSINNGGELYLSAPANSGVFSFQVIATTVITQATATATVYLTVEAVTICGDENSIVLPPLIILDRDEEEVHSNLVVLEASQYEGCHFSLTNRWPVDQTWLYVDENGLHTTAIDREHESIAFMALSQVQVELILSCASDNILRTKRSARTDWLGPYDYGSNKWILTESIPFNSRRSLVNLIVNDINDNNPIFIGKEYEPIAVGYPTTELEERILPRSLAELQATDADIGENAELLYWSSESALAVAPTTGTVHVRNGAQLQDNQILQVSATDRNGQGLTGSIQLMIKLLDLNNIAVVTVRDAFLDDESTILIQLSNAIGYEVKTLRSVVISDDTDDADVSRNFKDLSGVSLQLYVYGLINRQPVSVDRLAEDINGNAALISVVSTVSLKDYLEASQISVLERDTGLLVATIVLSVLLFALMVAVTVWFFLKWQADRNYDRFSDENSLASRNESLSSITKPADIPKPRLNIEELKKSERRLQEMLNAPIEEVMVEPTPSTREAPIESILDLSSSEPYLPIVIQSIDKLKDADDTDEDEFGEQKADRRKSVVTFNENVEKIIHVEDIPDDDSNSEYEVYRF